MFLSAFAFAFVFVCSLPTLYEKILVHFDEIFRIAHQWYKKQLIFMGDNLHLHMDRDI